MYSFAGLGNFGKKVTSATRRMHCFDCDYALPLRNRYNLHAFCMHEVHAYKIVKKAWVSCRSALISAWSIAMLDIFKAQQILISRLHCSYRMEQP